MGTSFFTFNDKYDLNMFIYQCGWEHCSPKESCGPNIRNHYVLHFITKGEGTFKINNKTYKIKTNEGFLIPPDESTYYEASSSDPWSYLWVGFNGVKASQYLKLLGADKRNPIILTNNPESIKSHMKDIIESSSLTTTRDLRMRAHLFLLLSDLIDSSLSNQLPNFRNDYIKKSIEYIENNYNDPISVTDLANYLGLNRSYFSNIFKQDTDMSPRDYIIKYRITKACELMQKDSTSSISCIADDVGYHDLVAFSKAFKKYTKVSPNKYRKTVLK